MGYSTDYIGVLKFSEDTTLNDVREIQSMIDDNSRWDLKITVGFDGIQWNGCEKTYDLEKGVNIILSEIRKLNPKFDLIGEFQFSGEDIDDRGVFKKGEDGIFKRFMHIPSGKKICCPHCMEYFYPEDID